MFCFALLGSCKEAAVHSLHIYTIADVFATWLYGSVAADLECSQAQLLSWHSVLWHHHRVGCCCGLPADLRGIMSGACKVTTMLILLHGSKLCSLGATAFGEDGFAPSCCMLCCVLLHGQASPCYGAHLAVAR